MLNIKNISIILLHFFYIINLSGQSNKHILEKKRFSRIMFYNVENLFDNQNDSTTNDDEFLPNGLKHWTKKKYEKKINNIASTIIGVGGWDPPEIIGLCEIENRKVLSDLCNHTGLRNLGYRIIHKESPDKRGIDVAMIYLKKQFKPLNYKTINISYPFSPTSKTRDILYVKGLLKKTDTIHVFINHWPSRWGGQLESERKRLFVAKTLENEIDSLFKVNSSSKIIILGDLNDYPHNKSLTTNLMAKTTFNNLIKNELYNLSAHIEKRQKTGSHKREGEWGVLDQIIVSGSLLISKSGIKTSINNAYIYDAPHLLVKDETYSGSKCFRTYQGYKYIGGFSDHLPVFIDLELVEK